jgi:predicted secreted protein
MASYEGSNGAVKLLDGTGTLTAVAQVRSWSISHSRDTVEDTSMGDSFRTHKKGLESWSGSMEVVFDDSVSAEVSAALNPSTDTVITGEWFPDVSVVATKFSGTIITTEYSVTASYDGLVTASISFTGTGALVSATMYSA